MKETASLSLEAKAAIVGAFYALERLFSASGKQGTTLTNLNSVLGISTETLQRYEYAARQVGVTNQELDGTFKSMQSTMTKTLMGEGAPKGFARVAQLTGNMTPADIKRFVEHPELLLQKLQEYAAKETNTGLKNEVLKSFGLSDSMIAAVNRKAFTPEILAKAPTYSDNEINQLDKANIAWSNLSTKIEMAVGKFNAAHGGELVKDISLITDQVLKLADAFQVLSEKFGLFEKFGHVLEGISNILKLTNETVDAVNSGKVKEGGLLHTDDKTVSEFTNSPLMRFLKGDFSGAADQLKENFNTPAGVEPRIIGSPIAPSPPSVAPKDNGSNQNINVNQTLNFQHDGTNAKQTGDSVKKAVRDSYRQLSSQAQGT